MSPPKLLALSLLALGACRTPTDTTSATSSGETSASTSAEASTSEAASSSESASSSSSGGAASSSSTVVASASSGTGGAGTGGGGPGGTHVRLVAANLTSGNLQSYDPGHGVRILQGINADIILVQEFNYLMNGPADFQTFTEEVCGMDCTYVRGPPAQIPNGIITRYSVVSSGYWDDPYVANRNMVWAQIDVPGDIDLWAISVHLLTGPERAAEAAFLASQIPSVVPANDYAVIGGDFNTKSRGEAALMNLDAMFYIGGPYPADQDMNDATSGPRTSPYDWVLPNDLLVSRAVPVVIGQSTFPSGAVIDTRVYQPLSDIAPALLDDSNATGMQHMAVVRDFAFE